METIDELWPGGPRYRQRPGVFRLGSDSVLLASFTQLGRVKTVCDLGCGGGILPVLLLAHKPSLAIDGVELDPAAAALARENAALNGAGERICVLEGDLRAHKTLLTAGKYDLVLSNPPYFAAGSGFRAGTVPDAREESTCTLADVCRAAAWAVRWGGSFSLVYRPERLSELCCALTACGLEPKRLRLVQNTAESAPSLVLLDARRGAAPGLKVEKPLLLTGPDGGESEEVQHIYRRGGS